MMKHDAEFHSNSENANASGIQPVEMEDTESTFASFPSPEEIRATADASHAAKGGGVSSKKRKIWIFSGSFIILLLVLLIVLLSTRQDRGSENRSSSPESSSSSSSSQIDDVIEYLTKHDVSDKEMLANTSTPQYQAARWLAQEDGENLSVPTVDTTELDGYYFMFRYVMAVNYFALGGDNWTVNPNFLSDDDICQWNIGSNTGVLCYAFNDVVLPGVLDLDLLELKGQIPTENGKLTTLRGISLALNELSGTIPTELCSLPELNFILLNHNLLIGSIPSCFGSFSELYAMYLSDNVLSGTVPLELRNLAKLEDLRIDDNLLYGDPIPVFNTFPNLTRLYANNNRFSSKIDSTLFANSETIWWVDLSDNEFTSDGAFPGHLFDLPTLNLLDLSKNKLSGSLPTSIANNTQLGFLSLYENQLSGPITSLTSLQSLIHLDLSKNLFTGPMDSIGQLSNLALLFLSENPFDAGPVPTAFASLPRLIELSLRNTSRTGALPDLAATLNLLDLGSNQLNGTIPATYGNHSALSYLLLNNNPGIEGTLPATFQDMVKLYGAFFDGTSLDNTTMDTLCTLRDKTSVNQAIEAVVEVIFVADCLNCTCSGCKCCNDNDRDGCSYPLLANVDADWEIEFQRPKYELYNHSKDILLG